MTFLCGFSAKMTVTEDDLFKLRVGKIQAETMRVSLMLFYKGAAMPGREHGSHIRLTSLQPAMLLLGCSFWHMILIME